MKIFTYELTAKPTEHTLRQIRKAGYIVVPVKFHSDIRVTELGAQSPIPLNIIQKAALRAIYEHTSSTAGPKTLFGQFLAEEMLKP